MPVFAIGISHHLVGLSDLARLNRATDLITAALDDAPALTGRVVLSTCNRFELYVESASFHAGVDAALAAVRAGLPAADHHLAGEFEVYADEAAVQHLMEVASGLDSMVIGEDEIIGQVRDALARSAGRAGPALHRLFNAALATGKAVSSQTDLGSAGRSLADVGLGLVRQRHFPLAGRRALVVGTGSYARVVVAALLREGCTAVSVYSPTGRAGDFAAARSLTAVGEADLPRALAAADLLVTCSGGERGTGPVIGADLLAAARGPESGLLPVLDLSLGGDVDPAAARSVKVDLIDLDEIGAHAPAERAAAVLAARELVSRGVETYLHLESGRAAAPAVTAMRAHVGQFIEGEIEGAARRYDPDTAAAVARSLRRVSNALLHTPSSRAAELARTGGLADYSRALQTLFGIAVEVEAQR